jgi:glycosyltransferase involved in cell wall biosynthesis
MQNTVINCPNVQEILDKYKKSKRQTMTALSLNKAYVSDTTKRRLLGEAIGTSKKVFDAGKESIPSRFTSVPQAESKPDLRLMKDVYQHNSQLDDKNASLSITFVTDELSASTAFESLLELAKQMFLLGVKTTVVARIAHPGYAPAEMNYHQVGLGGDLMSLIPESSLIVCGSYSILRAIKTAFGVPLVYFASEEDYLYPQIDIKDRLLMASAFSCVDLAICFNNRINKRLLHEYGLVTALMPAGIDSKALLPHGRYSAPAEQAKKDVPGTNALENNGTSDESHDDNFWHMQRNSFYRKNGVFGKERFDFSYHFMMRETNESLAGESRDESSDGNTNLSIPVEDVANRAGQAIEQLSAARKLLVVLENESELSSVDIVNKVADLLYSQGVSIEVVAAVKGEIHGLSEHISVVPVGSLDQLAALYAQAYLYLSIERGSNFAKYALMAMAAGIPVVSSDHYGIVDFARHGDNAMLAPVADAKSGVDLIKRILSDESLALRLRKGGLETAAAYDWEKIRGSYLAVFDLLAEVYGTTGKQSPANDQQLPLLDSASKVPKADFSIEEISEGKYKVRTLSSVTALRPGFDSLEFGSGDADLMAEKLRQGDFYALLIPVAKKVVGKIENVSWELAALNEQAEEKYRGEASKVYLDHYAVSPFSPRHVHPGVAALAEGDYRRAIVAFESQKDRPRHNAVTLRWVIVALMGLERFEDAAEMAVAGCASYMFNPDFYLLAHHSAKRTGQNLNREEVKKVLEMMGSGMKFPEWFADPLSLLDEEELLVI